MNIEEICELLDKTNDNYESLKDNDTEYIVKNMFRKFSEKYPFVNGMYFSLYYGGYSDGDAANLCFSGINISVKNIYNGEKITELKKKYYAYCENEYSWDVIQGESDVCHEDEESDENVDIVNLSHDGLYFFYEPRNIYFYKKEDDDLNLRRYEREHEVISFFDLFEDSPDIKNDFDLMYTRLYTAIKLELIETGYRYIITKDEEDSINMNTRMCGEYGDY